LQSLMWDKVGIIRSADGLTEAAKILATWWSSADKENKEKEISSFLAPSDKPSYELNNLVLCARLMTEAALLREESRGAHFRTDFPQPSPEWQQHIIFRRREKAPPRI